MGDRTPFVVGGLAIAGVVAWLLLRGDSARPAAPPAPAPVVRQAQPAPPAPTLPAPPTTATEDVFSAQPRDDAWARTTEAELAKRWGQIRGGTLASTECKQAECRLVVTGTQDALAQAIADLEGPRGLHGWAKSVLLSSPTIDGDTVTLRIYVAFAR